MLLTCLSHTQALDTAESNGHSTQGSTFDSDRVLKLIPEWARSVQNWSPLIGPLLDKMFLEPSNAIMVRFLSCISEYLADASELVLLHVLSHMKEQDKMDKGFMSSSDTKSSVDKTKLEKSLFDHLCPLLILRLLPQRVFDDIDSSTIYGKFLSGVNDYQDIKFEDFQCIAAFILERSWKIGSSKKKKTKKKKQRRKEKAKDQTFLELPSDLLQLVISRLPLKDNIRASAVCKTWHKACVSLRVVDTSPWLIYFSKTDESYELYDPSMQKTHILQYPELSGFRVCYSKDGWLLMYNANSYQLFFFNPFTRERIPVPPLWMAYDQRMAFSCAPTSTSCLLFTVSYVTWNYITIKTCCANAKEWNTFVFKNQLPRNFNSFEQIVFSKGVFYCLTNTGCLSLFDPSLSSWNVLPGRPSKRPGSNGCFMTEHQGEIFLIYMYSHMNPTVLKLDLTSFEWTERKTLGGLTIYASALSSESRAEQQKPSGIRNCLCLSVFHGFKRTCIYHKVDEESKVCLKWKKHNDPYENIWIMPPLNLLDLPLFDQLI